jgi:hypothetical protein
MLNEIGKLRPGAPYEVIGTIISDEPIHKLWRCFKCQAKGVWWKEEEFKNVCPKCGATKEERGGVWIQDTKTVILEDSTGTIKLELWKPEVNNLKVGDKIHCVNMFVKEVNYKNEEGIQVQYLAMTKGREDPTKNIKKGYIMKM